MQTATKQLWASASAAIVGSLGCVAPLVLITLGISGAWISQLMALEPYRPLFIGVMMATLAVENMACGTCPIVVKKALEKVPGVSAIAVDFDKKTATVTFDPDFQP
jgi:mercuric ion binding protein